MTEYEAIKYIEQHGFISDNVKDMAIKAIEEILQYRAIGTVEEVQKLKLLFGNENVEISELITKILKEYPEYLSIGTVEEFKALKEKETEILLKDGQLLYQQGVVDGYAKGIDVYVEKLKYNFGNDEELDSWATYDEIAEQLKAGGKNE